MSEFEQTPHILSEGEKNIRNIFYLSFRYSQGLPELQHHMFNWFIAKRMIDTALIRPQVPNYILDLSLPNVHIKVDDTDIQGFREMWEEAVMYSATRTITINSTEEFLTKKMIERDKKFQNENRPRAVVDSENKIEPDSRSDPHASFLRRYALNGKNTGHPAFNEMFAVMKGRLLALREEDFNEAHGAKRQLGMLVNKWQKNHKGFDFFDRDIAIPPQT